MTSQQHGAWVRPANTCCRVDIRRWLVLAIRKQQEEPADMPAQPAPSQSCLVHSQCTTARPTCSPPHTRTRFIVSRLRLRLHARCEALSVHSRVDSSASEALP